MGTYEEIIFQTLTGFKTQEECAAWWREEERKPRELTIRIEPPEDLYLGCGVDVPEFIAWLQGAWEQVPAEHRGGARFYAELESSLYDSGGWLDVRLEYKRMETDAEVAERLAEDKRRAEQAAAEQEARERAELDRLERERFGESET